MQDKLSHVATKSVGQCKYQTPLFIQQYLSLNMQLLPQELSQRHISWTYCVEAISQHGVASQDLIPGKP